jgi:hypothetical protein
MRRINVLYGITGAMALNAHGYRRATIDVDLAIGSDAIPFVRDHLFAQGWLEVFQIKQSVRDAQTGVRIDLISVDHLQTILIDGVPYQELAQLLQLKLRLGSDRLAHIRHLADVVEAIRTLRLPLDFGTKLSEDVRPKYEEFWRAVRHEPDEF